MTGPSGAPVVRRAGNVFIMWCQGCQDLHQVNDGWTFNGDEEYPTFFPSILVQGNNRNGQPIYCHSFVRDGKWQYLSDCKHWAAGLTLPMEPSSEWPPMIGEEE